MQLVLVIWASVLALGWLPLARKFQLSWQSRKNPVSFAICLVMVLFAYENAMFMLAVMGETTWRFYAYATRVFEALAIINFYVAFRWSDVKFSGNRRGDTKQPPAA